MIAEKHKLFFSSFSFLRLRSTSVVDMSAPALVDLEAQSTFSRVDQQIPKHAGAVPVLGQKLPQNPPETPQKPPETPQKTPQKPLCLHTGGQAHQRPSLGVDRVPMPCLGQKPHPGSFQHGQLASATTLLPTAPQGCLSAPMLVPILNQFASWGTRALWTTMSTLRLL